MYTLRLVSDFVAHVYGFDLVLRAAKEPCAQVFFWGRDYKS